jgi:uncharacterized protein YndB with AHSA1/START domain
MASEHKPITVSRRIRAPASEIFQLLADPGRHRDLDGSGMLRGLVSGTTISRVGGVFVMQMYFAQLGDYQVDIDYGSIWVDDMRQTLDRLDQLCTGQPGQ